MEKINFEVGTQVSPAKVTIDNVDHEVTPAVWEGNTPLSPFVLKTMQNNIEEEFQVDKTKISGSTSQEVTPSLTNVVPIENVDVYGVNEFDKDNVNSINAYFESSGGSIKSSSNNTTIYIPCKANTTYTVSRQALTDMFQIGTTGEVPTIGVTIIDFINGGNTAKSVSINTSANAKYIVYRCSRSSTDDLSALYDTIKIEENPTVTSYTPYGYGLLDLNLQKDTDTQAVTFKCKKLHMDDYIDEWGFHYNRNTLVLDGTETWNAIEGSNSSEDITSSKGVFSLLIKNNILLSSHFKNNNLSSITNNLTAFNNLEDAHFNVRVNNLDRIYFRNSSLSTVAELKSWLAEQIANGTPVKLENKLETTEDEEFDTTNQIAWNTLEDLLIQGYIFVNSSSDELQPAVTLTEYTANEVYRELVSEIKRLMSSQTSEVS